MNNQQQNLNVSLKDTTAICCESCQHDVFTQAFYLRKVSRFVTGTPEDPTVPVQVFQCAKCGHVNKEFLPPANLK